MSAFKTSGSKVTRCAVYTRKSTSEGLEMEFSSIDAQRESGEAYIKSQAHEGWVCLPTRYDDGGFTGANMDRPALQRLLADIEAGKIDVVVVYKVDRLSRSLMDFGRLMERFEKHAVSFVSVTQQLNTASAMGRLMLNVLLSFAEFERLIIAERTRDKIAATRRKGKWSGGVPVLGYTVVDTKLVVDPDEVPMVREIFELYLEHRSLLTVARILNERGWRTKQWTTKKGSLRGGRPFNKNSLYQLLTNVVYTGHVRYKDEVHPGEHQGIIESKIFDKVQSILLQNGASGGRGVRNKTGALLRGILRCGSCNCAMSHSFTTKGTRRYRYYVCTNAQKRGWSQCPAPSIPAGDIERFVVDQIREIGSDPEVIRQTLSQARTQAEDEIEKLQAERDSMRARLRFCHEDLAGLASTARPGDPRLADAHDRIREAEQRLTAIDGEFAALQGNLVDEPYAASVLGDFDRVWECLSKREQARVTELLVERVVYDGPGESVSISLRPGGFGALAGHLEEAAA